MEYKYIKAITEEGETTTLVVKMTLDNKLAYQLKIRGIDVFDKAYVNWESRDIVFISKIE
jgi:hypothetical protein